MRQAGGSALHRAASCTALRPASLLRLHMQVGCRYEPCGTADLRYLVWRQFVSLESGGLIYQSIYLTVYIYIYIVHDSP